jgi:hypothetical protein
MIRPEYIGHSFPIRDRRVMTNRREKIEVENVHNYVYHAGLK